MSKIDGFDPRMKLPRPMAGVVIPSYNYSDFVVRAIESVKKQTLTNFRCVIVDDGSTDNTREVVEAAIADDLRFVYVYQKNAGVANARNRGVFGDEIGDSVYVTCLDADDQLHEDFLLACVEALEKDRSIDIAYTGLYYVKPDGEEGLSPWPTQFDGEAHMQGRNQIPTCNMSRRRVWERLGGQRQRYAPEGAGEEDYEMWIRAAAYGFNAKKITDAGLFIYSWMSGRVSGNRQHKTTNPRTWHPWTEDGQYPFAAVVPPKKFSHKVRQYDEPKISVIIPVGPGHENDVITALDSLDAQTFRQWEAVVFWDSDKPADFILRTFPHIKLVNRGINGGKSLGAGYARNRAVEYARAPLLVFLDADDWLLPTALKTMYNAWGKAKEIIYTDYYGFATIDETYAGQLRLDDRLLDYNPKTGDAVMRHFSLEYECKRAQIQPDTAAMYIWGLVTMLVPRKWHDEIGGFDEKMTSWEDWDYQIRLARAGKCFTRVPSFEVAYRFYTGSRRDAGLRDYADLVKYMRDKYLHLAAKSEVKMCGCSGGNSTPVNVPVRSPLGISIDRSQLNMSDDDFVLCVYNHPNIGTHRVIGAETGRDYGYRGGGQRFLVHKADIAREPKRYVPVEIDAHPDPVTEEAEALDDVPAPEKISAKPEEPRRRRHKAK